MNGKVREQQEEYFSHFKGFLLIKYKKIEDITFKDTHSKVSGTNTISATQNVVEKSNKKCEDLRSQYTSKFPTNFSMKISFTHKISSISFL